MTTPTCKFCQKPASEHGMDRNTDVCVAKLKGWTDIKNIVMPAIGLVGLPPDGDEKEPVPRYSKDMNDAMTLWKSGWGIQKLGKEYLISSYNAPQPYLLANGVDFALAICRAYLIEAKEG